MFSFFFLLSFLFRMRVVCTRELVTDQLMGTVVYSAVIWHHRFHHLISTQPAGRASLDPTHTLCVIHRVRFPLRQWLNSRGVSNWSPKERRRFWERHKQVFGTWRWAGVKQLQLTNCVPLFLSHTRSLTPLTVTFASVLFSWWIRKHQWMKAGT